MKSILITILFVSAVSARVDSLLSEVVHWNDMKSQSVSPPPEIKNIMSGEANDLEILTVNTQTIPAGIKIHSAQSHPQLEELIIIKEGSLLVNVKNETKLLGPGSIALIYPGEDHFFENTSAAKAVFYDFQYKAKDPVDFDRGEKAGGSFMLDWQDVEFKKSDIGGRRDFFRRATSMLNNFEMHVSTLNEGLTNHAAHTHGAEEFVVMVKGDVVMLIGDEYYRCSEGDVIFLSSMIPHSLNNSGTGETIYFAFQFWQ